MEEFIARNPLQPNEDMPEHEADAELGALLLRYLRHGFERRAGAWIQPGRDEHETLRRTCHAAEVLHRLDLDADTQTMVREAGNWLINLPVRGTMPTSDRRDMHLYPSRFKTLAYLDRFDDQEVRRDFQLLLRKEVGGLVRNMGESDVLTTCIVVDSLQELDRAGRRHEVCSDEQYRAMLRALQLQLRAWRSPNAKTSERRAASKCEIDNARDLSYVFGLLMHADRENVTIKSITEVVAFLTSKVIEGARLRGIDLTHPLYAALQLAEHYRGDESVRDAVMRLLADLRTTYTIGESTRRWDLMSHTLVLRLLLTQYGDTAFTKAVAARFLRAAEERPDAQQDVLESDLRSIVRERMHVQLGSIKELSGGFTDDHVIRVPFIYWFDTPGVDGGQRDGLDRRSSTSLIVKQSTRDAFRLATDNYNQLPPKVRSLFVRLPTEDQVIKSDRSSSYFLIMEDLTNLFTFRHLFNEFDQRAMSEQHRTLLGRATALACDAVFRMFRSTNASRANFPGTQLSLLYLSQIEAKLTRAVAQVPWLKNPIQGYHVGDYRYKGLDYYLGLVNKHANVLQPRVLGLAHGDYHSRNIMLDRDCTHLKLIDLDKLTRSGDYLADLGTLIQDVCVYRRVSEPDRDFGLPREEIVFATNPSAEAGTVENAVRYPAMGRTATVRFQHEVLEAVERFATEIDDASWRPRFWLATASALLMRLAFQTEIEPAAVLYAEGVRLLHELSRYLEHGQPLPALFFPVDWPESQIIRSSGPADLPEWARSSSLLRGVHQGLVDGGLRAEFDRSAVRYYVESAGDGPVAALTPAHREAVARLLLCCEPIQETAPEGVRIIPNARADERLRTVLLLAQTATPEPVVRLALGGLDVLMHDSRKPATRRRG